MTDVVSEPKQNPGPRSLPAVTMIPIARGRVLVYLVLSSLMVLAGLAVPRSGEMTFSLWAGGGFFLACSLIFLVMLLPGAEGLVLTPDGVVTRNLFREHRIAWRQMTQPVAKPLIPFIPIWLIGGAIFAESVPAEPTAVGKSPKWRRIAIPLSSYSSHQEILRMMVAYWHQAQAASPSSSTLDPAGSKD